MRKMCRSFDITPYTLFRWEDCLNVSFTTTVNKLSILLSSDENDSELHYENDSEMQHRLGIVRVTKFSSQPFSMKWPSGVPRCMTATWSTTYVVEKCDVMWKLPHPVLTGGSERQLRKLTFGINLSNYNVG
ncbi:hypothetical protein AVEN_165934-1 [Araneus ventricosus]|uniref:Uncharacterized protein n=1 Tax=Araneus ventricosus TaxID=182803 RepID=A0A4Y2Q4N3_ARAVE|nr:hypothetical protein AVEN_165934-1 [Araneus ventricosus]